MPKTVRAEDFGDDMAARRAWLESLPANDNRPRKAAPTTTPRHAKLSGKLRSLLTWRAMSSGHDWTQIATNDNEHHKDAVPLLDSEHEVRPRISEMRLAIKDVDFAERRHAKLGGGGELHVVAVGGDVERGPVLSQRKKPECVVRLGQLRFSNGGQVERGLKLRDGRVMMADIELPLGAVVDMNGHRPRDRFGKAKKGGPEATAAKQATVMPSVTANVGAFDWVDPVAEATDAAHIRKAVKPETANILDLAIRAANFREIGEAHGHRGKHAERIGRELALAACEELDGVLTA